MSANIFNHKTLDTLSQIPEWLEEHFDLLKHIAKAIEDQETEERYMRRRDNVTLDASGNGTITFVVPNGFDWSLERITVTSTGNGMVQIYLNSVIPQETVEIIGSSQIYSDAFNNNVYAQQGEKVIIVFSAAGANGVGTANLQIKLLKRAEKVTRHLKAYNE